MQQPVGNLYDDLAGFESLLGIGKNQATYSIHKRLLFDQTESTQHLSDINEWILENLPIDQSGKVLDAGCGVGNTLLTFCQRSQMRGIGISLSKQEVKKANAAANKLQLADRCQFVQQSFTDDFDQKFDTIIAIESLKHAPDLKQALTNLAKLLNERGCLIIVEDFGMDNWSNDQNLKNEFLEYWSVQHFYSLNDFVQILNPLLGKHEQKVYDFTPFMESKSASKMLRNYRVLRILCNIALFPFIKSLLATFAGGFLLDYFYAQQKVKYQLLFLKKEGA